MPTGVKKPNPFEFIFATRDLDIEGHIFSFRELSVAENDACIDAARNDDGTINGRINMRMMIAKSSVEPKITVDDIAKVPNRIYLKMAEFVNEVNALDDAEEKEEEGKKEGEEGKKEGNG